MRWRAAAQHALMWSIRYAPFPWALKRLGIWLASPRTVVIVSALIPDGDGRTLILRARYSGRWIPPGGALHPGENPLEGLRRECREELGGEVHVLGLAGLYARPGTRELFIAFRCAPLPGPPRLSAEHEAYRYAAPAELPWWLRVMAEDARRGDTSPPAVRTLEHLTP